MMKRSFFLFIILSVVLMTGCETITYDAQLFEGVASLNGSTLSSDYSVVGKFKYETRSMFTVYDLITLKNPEIVEALQKSVKVNNGDAVLNISIVEETDIIDILIAGAVNTVTRTVLKNSIDLFSTRSVLITGDVVKYNTSSMLAPDQTTLLLAAGKKYDSENPN